MLVVAADGFNDIPVVGDGRHYLMLASVDRPELPAVHSVSVTHVEKWPHIIVVHDVLFPRLAVNGKHHEENLVAEDTVFEMSIKRNYRGIIIVCVRPALLEIERKDGKAPRFLKPVRLR